MGDIKKILVTGANGFLGSHLLHLLIKKGYTPVVFLRMDSDTWRIKHLQESYEAFISDGNPERDMQTLFEQHDIEAVLHTATEYGRQKPLSKIIETNVIFPLKLIETGLKHKLK